MSEFSDSLTDVFEQFASISCKRMFGGYGVYHDGLMFGLVVDDNLYLKADAGLAEVFKQRGLPPFEYNKQGKNITIRYYLAPEEIYDDPELAAKWAKQSYAVALTAARQKTENIKTSDRQKQS